MAFLWIIISVQLYDLIIKIQFGIASGLCWFTFNLYTHLDVSAYTQVALSQLVCETCFSLSWHIHPSCTSSHGHEHIHTWTGLLSNQRGVLLCYPQEAETHGSRYLMIHLQWLLLGWHLWHWKELFLASTHHIRQRHCWLLLVWLQLGEGKGCQLVCQLQRELLLPGGSRCWSTETN